MKSHAVLVAIVLTWALFMTPVAPSWAQTAAKREPGGGSASPSAGKSPGKARSGSRRGRRDREAVVVLDTVTLAPVSETVPVYGRIVARQAGAVAARSEGGVETVHAEVGDRVTAGDPLVTLVSNTLQAEHALKTAEVTEFRAKIRTAEAQLNIGRQELARLRRLRRSAAFSSARFQDKQQDVERLKSALGEARARVDQAMAQLKMAEIDLDNAVIRAPYPGVVSRRHTEVGAYVKVGDKIVTLINDTALEVEAEVPAVRIGGLGPDTVVTVTPETGAAFEATFRAVVPEENPLARTRTARFVPLRATAPLRMAANQSVALSIPTGPPRQSISVHKDSVIHRQGSPTVFVYSEGKVSMRAVRLGEPVGTRFEVKEGLKPGEKVVVRGNERLRDGQKVRVRGTES